MSTRRALDLLAAEAAQRRAAALDRLTRSRVEQGFPLTVEDAVVLRRVATLVESPVRSQQVSA